MKAAHTSPDVAEWVRVTTAAQGLAVKVEDRVVLSQVVALLGARVGAARAQGALAPRTDGPQAHSDAPVRLHAVGVESAPAGDDRRQDRRAG